MFSAVKGNHNGAQYLNTQRKVRLRLIQGAIVGGVCLAWTVGAARFRYVALSFSSPIEVLGLLGQWSTDPARWLDLWATLYAAAAGYAVGVAVGALMTAVVCASRLVAGVVNPFIAAANAIPKVMLAPIFIVWFGIELQSRVLFVTSVIFFLAFYTLVSAIRTIDSRYLDAATVLGASRYWRLREVYLPATFGALMTSLRLCGSWALVGALLSEYLGSNRGIGHQIARGQQLLIPDQVVAGLVVAGTVAIIIDRLLARTEIKYSQWRLT